MSEFKNRKGHSGYLNFAGTHLWVELSQNEQARSWQLAGEDFIQSNTQVIGESHGMDDAKIRRSLFEL
jgi:hypothetical protein